ncbi:MAG: DUF1636 domain-containing protein [Albidovulum sp.]|nr:DUF1636 domain-containing protein [Albidovulum sp.]
MSTLFVCITCRMPHFRDDKFRTPCGESMLEIVDGFAEDFPNVSVKSQSCLMGCEHGCNVAVAAKGKMNYVLGRFEPNEKNARAILEYASKHADSKSGIVPFREWPKRVKGHFIARIPSIYADDQ